MPIDIAMLKEIVMVNYIILNTLSYLMGNERHITEDTSLMVIYTYILILN